ncbi:MAG: ATP-binding cassette domain-containing protein [Deltaproteobacteria bacterium]|nr:ATP-binding cassette domain-containing protein [Deltaproteobacteria bacterium]MBW2673845.1 ATP-binding cassette domain-containing protein [Deltaproteobacteria bacterium]
MIQVNNLRKTFGPIVAVDDVSFQIKKGDVLGFIGPNGAGKTTAMRMLACLIKPDSGNAKINGADILEDSLAVRRSIGYLPENTPLYGEMTTASFLNFICDIRQIERDKRKAEIERVMTVCSLHSVHHQTIETLSKGYRKRVGLAAALVDNPPVLILDEPTDGLDPNQKRVVRTMIISMAKDKAIIVSTHILEELEAICNRAVVVDRGRIIADSTPAEFKEQGNGRIDEYFEKITRGDS